MRPRSPSSDRRAPPPRWLGWGLLLAGCGPSVSLDPPAPTTASSSGATDTDPPSDTGSSSAATTSPEAGDGPRRDVPEPVPEGLCPEHCTVDLEPVWSWTEEPPGPGSPLQVSIKAMKRAPDGSLVIGEHRDDQAWLRRVSSNGVVLWTIDAQLGCPCEIASLAPRPDGTLMVAGHGPYGADGIPVVTLSSYDLPRASRNWVIWSDFFDQLPHRIGSVFPIDAVHTGVVVADVDYGETGLDEKLLLYYYEGNFLADRAIIDTQPAGDIDALPVGWAIGSGDIAVGLTDATGSRRDGYLVWLDEQRDPDGLAPLPGPPEAIAPGPDGDVVLAGRRRSAGETTLHVSRGRPDLPLDWTFTTPVEPVDSSPVAVTVHDDGAVTVGRRTIDDEGDAAIVLWRLDAQGQLLWTTTHPATAEPGPPPLYLEHLGEAVVVATLEDGRSHVETLEPSCRCE